MLYCVKIGVVKINELFLRTEMLIGKEGIESLRQSRVAVFGIGGVGSFVTEALARAGIGKLLLCDNDVVADSNRNRQLVALATTTGKSKVQVMRERIAEICPETVVEVSEIFCLPDNVDEILTGNFDYIVDAIDTVSAKIAIIEYGQKNDIPVISVMGTGNKLDPARFEITDIYKTSVCPLCRAMRRELRVRGITAQPVVYSREEPRKPLFQVDTDSRRAVPGSISFVPPVAGMIAAGEVVRGILQKEL